MDDIAKLIDEARTSLDTARQSGETERRGAMFPFMSVIEQIGRVATLEPKYGPQIQQFARDTATLIAHPNFPFALWISELDLVSESTFSYERFEQLQWMRSSLQFLFDLYRDTTAADFLSTVEQEDIVDIDDSIRDLAPSFGGATPPEGTPEHHWWWSRAASQ